MNLEDFDEFSKVVMGFAELRGRELSAPAVKLYFNALSDWSLDEFKQAAVHLLKASKWMPTPYEFAQLRKAGELTKDEAWTQALAACVSWRTPEQLPTGRVARAAAAVGGFRTIALADQETSLPFLEKRFKEAYEDLTDVEATRQALPQVGEAARIRLRGPVAVGNFLPSNLTRKGDTAKALPAPSVKNADPQKAAPISTRDKVAALAKLHADFTAEDIARIAGEPLDLVRAVMAEVEHAA